MKLIEKTLLFLIGPLYLNGLYSQQEASFNLYMFNNQSFNSGYVGSKNYSTFTLLNRSQWAGFDGSPKTGSFSYINARSRKNLAFAITGIIDQIGPVQSNQFSTDLAYHLKLNSKNNFIGLGLKLSASFFDYNANILNPQQKNDQVLFQNNVENYLEPNIGFGFYYHTPNFYLGYSIPGFIENDNYYLKRHHYFLTGGLLKMSPSLQLKPSVLLKKVKATPLTYDFSVLLYLKNLFWIGPQIKNYTNFSENFNLSGVGVGALAGLHLSKHISVGYVYSNALGILNSGNLTSHEMLIRYELSPKELGILRSPRIF